MKNLKKLGIIKLFLQTTICISILCSCSSDLDSDQLLEEIEGAELMGDWEGKAFDEGTDEGFERQYEISIGKVSMFAKSGEWKYKFNSTDDCDAERFNCLNSKVCIGDLIYRGKSNDNYQFTEEEVVGTCRSGRTEIEVVDENTINYILLLDGNQYNKTKLSRI